jgi:hypothetical protein
VEALREIQINKDQEEEDLIKVQDLAEEEEDSEDKVIAQ